MDVKKYFEENFSEDVQSMQHWADSMYEQASNNCFSKVMELSEKMDSESRPITDQELEWILTSLPLNLFQIAEALNQLRLKSEYMKLINRHPVPKLKSEEDTKDEETDHKLESSLVTEVFNSVIRRIENEISFSKELIMGAKKVWDSRRQSEKSNPVGEVNSEKDLPDYTHPQTYIK